MASNENGLTMIVLVIITLLREFPWMAFSIISPVAHIGYTNDSMRLVISTSCWCSFRFRLQRGLFYQHSSDNSGVCSWPSLSTCSWCSLFAICGLLFYTPTRPIRLITVVFSTGTFPAGFMLSTSNTSIILVAIWTRWLVARGLGLLVFSPSAFREARLSEMVKYRDDSGSMKLEGLLHWASSGKSIGLGELSFYESDL